MKRAFSLALAVLLIVSLFSGCAQKGELSIAFGDSTKIERKLQVQVRHPAAEK